MKRDFSHPFTPYSVQEALMEALYATIDGGFKVGVFESPTGTGKTLLIICAAMTWLREHRDEQDGGGLDSDLDPEWVREAYRQSRMEGPAKAYELHLDAVEAGGVVPVVQPADQVPRDKRRRAGESESDAGLVPDEYASDGEAPPTALLSEVKRLMARIDGADGPTASSPHTQILFSSRTHLQLSQFAGQLQLPSFAPTFSHPHERTKLAALAGRAQLCINPAVRRRRSPQAVRDACHDLAKTSDKCEFWNRELAAAVTPFVDHGFTRIHDIEELVRLGSALHVCPYYLLRAAVAGAEVVALPYQMLLLAEARAAMGVLLTNAIVVVDEAHNLLDAVRALHLALVLVAELERILQMLTSYNARFKRRMSGGNRVRLAKVQRMAQVLLEFCRHPGRVGQEVDALDIVGPTTADLLNIHKLERYLSVSRVAYKIELYAEQQLEGSVPQLMRLTQFMHALATPLLEGRFFWDQDEGGMRLCYQLLDPAEAFASVVRELRCVLLCGGTMEPVDELLEYLVPQVPRDRIQTFTCGHVIPDENLMAFPVEAVAGVPMELTFDKRSRPEVLQAIRSGVEAVAAATPGGVVVFFVSYSYLEEVVRGWGYAEKVFVEPRGAGEVDGVLAAYAEKATAGSAVLLAVVGGKMSEGINFADRLARAVVMVGIPFPNSSLGEVTARRRFVEQRARAVGGEAAARAKGQAFYDNLAMRAVNQCVGRAIRHRNDYAVLYLVDVRYGTARIQEKLLGWVRRRVGPRVLLAEAVRAAAAMWLR